jgi:hypothetical protein
MLIRRSGQTSGRFLALRVALVFLGSGIWIGGVIADSRWATGVAIGVVGAALLLGLVGRKLDGDPQASEVEEDPPVH